MDKKKEHAKKKAELDSRKAEQKKQTQERVSQFHLRFVHVRAKTDIGHDNPKGGVTIAYSPPLHRNSRLIEVAISLVHENDCYEKAIGRYWAAVNFDTGQRITVRIPKGLTIPGALRSMFYSCT